MAGDLRGGQGCAVNRDIVDAAGEVLIRGLVRPSADVVAANLPVTVVRLSRGNGRVLADTLGIDVQRHAGAAHRRHHVVPLTVVVRRAARDRHGLARIDAEDDLPRVVHVEVPVIAAAVASVAVTETDDLATRRRGRVDPRLDGE